MLDELDKDIIRMGAQSHTLLYMALVEETETKM